MIKPLQIGGVTLPNNLILAPMAGVTDLPFRLLCKEQGAGLAAPQVGILRRIVVVEVEEGNLIELINPKIIAYAGEQEGTEGCLSVPNKWGTVKRPMHVTVRALNRYGEEFEITGSEFLARALCHEIDHLDGILYKDKLDKGETLFRTEVESD